MMGNRVCVVLAVTFCLSVNAVYAQESDRLCDKWFSQERFECPKDYTATIQVPCIPPLQFEPGCVTQEVDAIQEYLLSLYETIDRYSGMFNDMVKETIILAALDFYQAANDSATHFYDSIREGNYAEAAATVIDDVYPGDFRSMMARSDQFYSAIEEGDYEKALTTIVEDTIVEAIRRETKIPTDVQTLSENAQKFYKALENGDFEQAATIAANDIVNFDAKSRQARAFYSAMKTGDYQKAVIQASRDIVKGTATKSDYYLTPFRASSVATAVKLSTDSNGRRDSLYYPPTFQDIISEAKIIEKRPQPASGT